MKCKVLLILMLLAPFAQGQSTYFRFVASTVSASSGINLQNSGSIYQQISWTKSGTLATCQVQVDSSADGVTWNSGDIVASQACTSNGNVNAVHFVSNYSRVNVTAISGGGSVTVVFTGYTTNPVPSGGSVTSIATTSPITGGTITTTGTIACPTCNAFSALTGGTNTAAAMAVGTGASETYSGTGSINASNSPFLLTAFPVSVYGAKCDGSTDDTTAIQAAETAAELAGSGSTVIFPAAQCNYSTTLTIQANGIHWVGQGERSTVLMDTTAGNDFLDITGPSFATSLLFGSIQGITFKRNLAFTGGPNGLKLLNVQFWTFESIEVWDSASLINCLACANNLFHRVNAISNLSAVTNSFDMQTGDSTILEDCVSAAVGGHVITNALNIFNSAADLWIERINVAAGGGDVVITGAAGNPASQDVHFISPILEPASAAAALQITSTNGNNCGLSTPCQITIVDPHIVNSAGPDIVLTNAQGVNIIGGDIRCIAATNCVQVTGASSTNDTMNGNWFRSAFGGASPTSFVDISSAGKNISVVNNQFFGTSSFPFGTAITVTGTTGGVYSNNAIGGNGTTAVSFDNSSSSNILQNNTIDTTNITTAIADANGTNTGPPSFFLDPSKYSWFFDDFITSTSLNAAPQSNVALNTGGAGISWTGFTTGTGAGIGNLSPSDSGTNGVLKLTSGNVSGNYALLVYSSGISGSTLNGLMTPFSGTTFDYKIRVALGNTTNVTYFFGFQDGTGIGELSGNVIAIAFDTTQSDTTFTAVCRKASTSTRTTITGATLDTNYHDLRIHSNTAGTVLFSVDGGAEISIATNVPTVSLSPYVTDVTRQSAATTLKIDYFQGWVAISR